MMKRIRKRAIVVLVASILGTQLCLATLHTLESVDGKRIRAEITRVTDTDAHIIVNRKVMKVSLDKFAKETQAYLKEWQKNNVSYSLSISKTAVVVKKVGGAGDVHHYGFNVVVTNRDHGPVPALKVRYQIYNTANEMRSGEAQLFEIGALGEQSFTTVAGSRTKYKRFWRWGSSGKAVGQIGHHLGGIWLRMYNEEGKMVHEWKNLNSKVRKPVWKLDD